MAKVQPALPFNNFSGRLTTRETIVMRTRNGVTHAYAIMRPYTGPLAESRKQAISTFSQAVRQCKDEMSNPERLAYWQNRYQRYVRLARRSTANANAQFLGTPTTSPSRPATKFYSTLRGFIIASLAVNPQP